MSIIDNFLIGFEKMLLSSVTRDGSETRFGESSAQLKMPPNAVVSATSHLSLWLVTDTTPLCLALQLHQVNKDPTHKRGRTLDLRLANAPRCYVSETWAPLHDDHNNRSDHFVILSYPPESKYKATLAPLCTKSIPKKMNTNRLKL